MSVRVEHIGSASLYLGDCREILPTLGSVDALVTDPPYGIGRDRGNETRYGSGFYRVQVRKQYEDDWDYQPDRALLAQIVAAAPISIIWGGNYFTASLPENGHWLVWDKQNTMPTFSDCELAWTNIRKHSVKLFRYSNNGIMAKEKDRVHPTQKPVELMSWCINCIPSNPVVILDPFMGSGSTAVAALNLCRNFIGIEIAPKYFEVACKRVAATYRQLDLFRDYEPPYQSPHQMEFDEAKDARDSYDLAVHTIGERVKAGEPIPDFFRSDRESR